MLMIKIALGILTAGFLLHSIEHFAEWIEGSFESKPRKPKRPLKPSHFTGIELHEYQAPHERHEAELTLRICKLVLVGVLALALYGLWPHDAPAPHTEAAPEHSHVDNEAEERLLSARGDIKHESSTSKTKPRRAAPAASRLT